MMDPLIRAQGRSDGRDIDPDVGALSGEGALQRARASHDAYPVPRSRTSDDEEGRSYHGIPVLKEPVWKWMIPAYFFTGGLAGASAVLGAAAQLAADPGTRELVRRCRLVSAGGAVASAALLIADLGRPTRFLNMMRVFRPTSPMNMGTWVLAGFSTLAGISAAPTLLPDVRRRRWALGPARPPFSRTADAAALGAGVLGLPLVGYTGVLLAGTAVPVWQQTRNTLPVLFAFSGAVSAGAVFDVWPPGGRGDTVARTFGLLAKGAELATSFALDREADRVPRVDRALRRGRARLLLSSARGLLIASAAAEMLPIPRRLRRRIIGTLALAGTLALRFGVVAAGRASALDPHATFAMQRAGAGASEIAARERGAHMPSLPGVEPTGNPAADVPDDLHP